MANAIRDVRRVAPGGREPFAFWLRPAAVLCVRRHVILLQNLIVSARGVRRFERGFEIAAQLYLEPTAGTCLAAPHRTPPQNIF
eukprot:5229822-Prymnesium_polylepis.3